MSTIKYEKFTPENVNYCQDFLSYVSSVDPYKLKFFDEAGFALPGVGKANYGHSAANHPCVEIGRHLGAPNVSLNMLIGLKGDYGGGFGTKFGNGSYLRGNWSYPQVSGSYLEGNES